MSSIVRVVLLGLLLAAGGCPGPIEQGAAGRCDSATRCVAGAVSGRCSAAGRCVYPAPVTECNAGLRTAAGACVQAEAPTLCGCADDGNPCTREVCADGECVHPADFNGNGCPGGVCIGGACCTGCWDGASCRTGLEADACGSYGGRCESCPPVGSPPDPCHAYGCPGICVAEPINGPGCPHCGSLDELCCAGHACGTGLSCVSVGCGEDCMQWRCRP